MHCLLEGIGKKLCSLWFTPSRNEYYIGRYADLVNERVLSIKPPDTITRTPRKVTDRKHWKGTFRNWEITILHTVKKHHFNFAASEYRAWMLFYSLLVLEGVLPAAHYEHLALLVCSMHILLNERILKTNLDVVQRMLDQFYMQFDQLYGECSEQMYCTVELALCIVLL